jgi:peptidoglycan/xylan/chitin deacetylase (PgdA/CDA1 family)
MIRQATSIDESLDYRFLFTGGGSESAFRNALAADMRAAQLTAAFRAYYRVRSLVPLRVRHLLQRFRPVDVDECWYFSNKFTNELAMQIAGGQGITTIHPWPDGAKFAFVPTHDVETAEGMQRIETIARLEEELGFRSAWNIIPYKYPVDRGLVRDLQDRGFEIGVHGYNHDGKLFTSRRMFDSRVAAINRALQTFDAVGFRAPMVHRNLEWLQSLNIDYDASCFDVDPFQAMPGGVGGMWPFIAGKFVELPYTIPQDHTLFIALHERNGRIWQDKLEFISRNHGMALIITHPDYLDSGYRLDAYRELLETVQQTEDAWRVLPREVANWWRQRDRSILDESDARSCKIVGPAAERGRVAKVHVASGLMQWSD